MIRKLCEKRQTRKGDNFDPSFSPSTLRVSHGCSESSRKSSTSCMSNVSSVLSHRSQFITFTVRKSPLSPFLLYTTLLPRSSDLPLCHVCQFRGPCNVLISVDLDTGPKPESLEWTSAHKHEDMVTLRVGRRFFFFVKSSKFCIAVVTRTGRDSKVRSSPCACEYGVGGACGTFFVRGWFP